MKLSKVNLRVINITIHKNTQFQYNKIRYILLQNPTIIKHQIYINIKIAKYLLFFVQQLPKKQSK